MNLRKSISLTILALLSASLASCKAETPQVTNSPAPTVASTQVEAATDTVTVPSTEISTASPSSSPEPTQIPTLSPPEPPIPMPLMGVELLSNASDERVAQLVESGADLIRYNGILWHQVEAIQGQYDWTVLQSLEATLQRLAAQNIEVIMIVRGTPEWAQKVPGSYCGAIDRPYFSAYAEFVAELVKRYSAPPYNIKYWELGNEPDIAPELVGADSVYGCWGDSEGEYYGGVYYADMLRTVYPAIKSANPEAQVLMGGLLMDCDPDNPPEGQSCLPTRFIDGILKNGGGDFFDGISYHGYVSYYQRSLALELIDPKWQARGGSIVGKVDYLRSTLQRFGLEKPIFLTESSLLCPEWNPDDCAVPDELFFDSQADYLVRTYLRTWAYDLAGTVWFNFEGNGWRYGGMVGTDQANPKPAYRAFKYMNEKLEGMDYIGHIFLDENIEAYRFSDAQNITWVLWSRDQSPVEIDFPPGTLAASDKFGQSLPMDGVQLSVSSPVYLDMAP